MRIIESSFGPNVVSTASRGEYTTNRTYVMRGIRVFVNSTEKSRGSIFPDLLCQQMTAARVLIEERTNVVNETRDDDKGAGLRLLQDCDVPVSSCRKHDVCERSQDSQLR